MEGVGRYNLYCGAAQALGDSGICQRICTRSLPYSLLIPPTLTKRQPLPRACHPFPSFLAVHSLWVLIYSPWIALWACLTKLFPSQPLADSSFSFQLSCSSQWTYFKFKKHKIRSSPITAFSNHVDSVILTCFKFLNSLSNHSSKINFEFSFKIFLALPSSFPPPLPPWQLNSLMTEMASSLVSLLLHALSLNLSFLYLKMLLVGRTLSHLKTLNDSLR